MHFEELKELGSENAVKAAGKYRCGPPRLYLSPLFLFNPHAPRASVYHSCPKASAAVRALRPALGKSGGCCVAGCDLCCLVANSLCSTPGLIKYGACLEEFFVILAESVRGGLVFFRHCNKIKDELKQPMESRGLPT